MLNKLLILASVLQLPVQLLAAEVAKPAPFETHDGYFVSNKFEPKESTSFAVLKDQASFNEVFGVGMVMRDKSHRLAPNAFAKKLVVAAIHRGKAMVTYQVQSLVTEAQTLIVTYTTKSEPNATAEFSCPLILSLDQLNFHTVRFVENGKEIKTLKIPPVPPEKPVSPNPALQAEKASDGKLLYSIKGPGIGQATITCKPEFAAQEIVLRIYLNGLESLTLTTDRVVWKASVLSHSNHQTLVHLWENGKEGPPLSKENAAWAEIRRVDAEGKPVPGLPPAGGWFELSIPKVLLKDTTELKLSWIDFYR